MMTQQDKERYDMLVDTIDECLRILHEEYGSAFILSICTEKDDDNVLVHSGCNGSFKEVLVMFEDLAEEDRNIAKAMGLIAEYTELKNK